MKWLRALWWRFLRWRRPSSALPELTPLVILHQRLNVDALHIRLPTQRPVRTAIDAAPHAPR
jgi:hypothetical protein